MDITTDNLKTDKFYPLKVWLTTVVFIAPILLFVGNAIFDPAYFKNHDNFLIPFLFIGLGLVLSLPTLLLCYLVFSISSHKLNSSVLIKIIFIVVCVTGIFITFSLIGGSEAKVYSFFYSASVIISSISFKVYKK